MTTSISSKTNKSLFSILYFVSWLTVKAMIRTKGYFYQQKFWKSDQKHQWNQEMCENNKKKLLVLSSVDTKIP